MILNEKVNELLREAVKYTKILNLDPEYWRIETLIHDTPVSIPAGSSKELLDIRERGKVVLLYTLCNNKNTLLEVYIDNMLMRGTPSEIYKAGLVGYNPTTFWLSRFDETNNRYVVLYTPVPPKEYFGRVYIKLYAPKDSSVTFKYLAVRYKYVG